MRNNTHNNGTNALEALQIVFIVLKLTKLIDWSWPVVLIPFWFGLGLAAIAFIALLVVRRKKG